MNAITADSFAGLVALALERMAFVVVEPMSESAAAVLVRSVAHAAIDVHGSQDYRLMVAVTPGIVREVAAGMMGLDADDIDVDDHAQATAAELANILAGELVMLLTGGDAQMSLGLPCHLGDEAAGQALDAAVAHGFTCVLGCEVGCLAVSVQAVES